MEKPLYFDAFACEYANVKFIESVKYCWRNYDKCSGAEARASRSQFWHWYLFSYIGWLFARAGDYVLFHVPSAWQDIFFPSFQVSLASTHSVYPLTAVFEILTLLPTINAGIRRMHDIDRTGWILLINGIPLLGHAIFVALACLKGTEGTNSFGSVSV